MQFIQILSGAVLCRRRTPPEKPPPRGGSWGAWITILGRSDTGIFCFWPILSVFVTFVEIWGVISRPNAPRSRYPRLYQAETLPKHVLDDFKNISLFTIYSERKRTPRKSPRPDRAETSSKHVLDDFKNISLFIIYSEWRRIPRRKSLTQIGLKLHQNMFWTILRTFIFFYKKLFVQKTFSGAKFKI